MSRSLRRLSPDWVESWGHRVLLVETFVDPSRHIGTCYGASSFLRLGETQGSGRYVARGQVKDVYLRALTTTPPLCSTMQWPYSEPCVCPPGGSGTPEPSFTCSPASSPRPSAAFPVPSLPPGTRTSPGPRSSTSRHHPGRGLAALRHAGTGH